MKLCSDEYNPNRTCIHLNTVLLYTNNITTCSWQQRKRKFVKSRYLWILLWQGLIMNNKFCRFIYLCRKKSDLTIIFLHTRILHQTSQNKPLQFVDNANERFFVRFSRLKYRSTVFLVLLITYFLSYRVRRL